jgi:primosomal protein N' (replication factor Y)
VVRREETLVTALLEVSAHAHLRPLLSVISRPSLITPKVLQLARWIAEYYCCPTEVALKSVLPDAVRKEKESWRYQRLVRLVTPGEKPPKLTQRQIEVLQFLAQNPALR